MKESSSEARIRFIRMIETQRKVTPPPDRNLRRPKLRLPAGSCDTHVHVFGPQARFPLLPNRKLELEDCTLDDLLALHDNLGIERALLVQSFQHGNSYEYMLNALGREPDRLRGVASPASDITDVELDVLQKAGVIAARFAYPASPVIDQQLLGRLAERGWQAHFMFEGAEQIAAWRDTILSYPNPIVIEHTGNPHPRAGLDSPEFRFVLECLDRGDCWVKLSPRWSEQRVLPFSDVVPFLRVLIARAPERLVWGSDWPHPAYFNPMPNDADLVDLLAVWIPDPAVLQRVMVTNPAEAFGWGDPSTSVRMTSGDHAAGERDVASWANPVTTRSRVVTEIASELVARDDQPLTQAKVLLRKQGTAEWPLTLFGSSTYEGVDAVVRGEAALAMVNPSAALTLAYRGAGSYDALQPVRTLAVLPSEDQYVFAVKRELGITTFEEIASLTTPLRIAVRGQRDHCLHAMLDHIAAAAGFTMDDLRARGGGPLPSGPLPKPGDAKFQAFARGEIEAIFDEAVQEWIEAAVDAGMTILGLTEPTVRKLEAMGYRRAIIPKALYPTLPADVLTIDFSGWPIFVHAGAPDALVAQMCHALDARKALIPWQGSGPLPLDRMVANAAETPMDVPFHPAAQRVWRELGYLA